MRKALVFPVLIVLVALRLVPNASAGPTPSLVTCGLPVTSSIVLANSLFDCPLDGLVVKAPNITIDLAGFTIDGNLANDDVDATEAGINNAEGHAGVVVRNGAVKEFEVGVFVGSLASGNRIAKMRSDRNTTDGFSVGGSRNALISDTASGNGANGYFLAGERHVLEKNFASANASDGFEFGFDLVASRLRLELNKSLSNGDHGFNASGSGHQLRRNSASGNEDNGFRSDGTDQSLSGNRSWGNAFEGFEVSGTSHDLISNSAWGNGGNGIELAGGANHKVVDNRTHRNGYVNGVDDPFGLGIVVGGSVTGLTAADNKASGNDDPAQCSAVAACSLGSLTPPTTLVTCDYQVTESIVVANSLFGCPMDGLVVKAPNITVDLGGFTIDGNDESSDYGVKNTDDHDGVVMRNGTIKDFGVGVLIDPAPFVQISGNRIENIRATSNRAVGFFVGGSENVLRANVATANGTPGFSGDAGFIFVGDGHRLIRNRSEGDGQAGFNSTGERHFLKGNRSWGNVDGFSLANSSGSEANILRNNWASGNQFRGIQFDGSGHKVFENVARGNGAEGFQISGSDHALRFNKALANGHHGISVSGDNLTIVENKAHRNGFANGVDETVNPVGLGIFVDPATTGLTAAKNKAKGNDDPAQCSAGAGCS